jgi:hypothetical protein
VLWYVHLFSYMPLLTERMLGLMPSHKHIAPPEQRPELTYCSSGAETRANILLLRSKDLE